MSDELDDFRREVQAWFSANKPADPGFLLPESFMEVGTDPQFQFLRAWQRKVYDAGYLGMAWPQAYGGADARRPSRTSSTPRWRARRPPSCPIPSG